MLRTEKWVLVQPPSSAQEFRDLHPVLCQSVAFQMERDPYSVVLCMEFPLYLSTPLPSQNLWKLYPAKAQSAILLWWASLLWQLYSELSSQYCKLLIWMWIGRGERERKGAVFQTIFQGKICCPCETQVRKTQWALLSPSCSTELVLTR